MRFPVNQSGVAICGVVASVCVLALGSCGSDAAALWVTPTSQEGMDITDGSSPGAVFSFTLENRGDSATGLLRAPELGGDDPGSFEVVQDNCSSLTLGPARKCTFGLRAVASGNGAYKARFAVGDGDITSNVIAVSGTASGFVPQAALVSLAPLNTGASSSMNIDGGASPGDAVAFFVSNNGSTATAALRAPQLTGDDPEAFEVLNDQCTGRTVAPGATCTFDVRPLANSNRSYRATLTIGDGTLEGSLELSGTAAGFSSGTPVSWDDVEAGTNHSCGIADGGDLYCWGDASNGRVGNGSTTGTVTEALRIGAESDWSAIASGDHHTCGIRGGKLYCWGGDTDGELGNGAGSDDVSTPEEIGASFTGDWTHVDAGAVFSCGINDRNTFCWGNNELGSVGNTHLGSTTDDFPLPSPVRGSFVSDDASTDVWTGGAHACAIISDRFVCWGREAEGQLGLNDRVGSNWTQVAFGNNHGCGLRGGELHCWGNNENGQLGNGKDGLAAHEDEPVRIGTSTGWTHVSAGVDHTCGLDAGRLFCWGKNVYGQQAGASGNITTPQQVGASTSWSTFITTGGGHSCAIRDNSLVCWGDNSLGQCGEFFVGLAP